MRALAAAIAPFVAVGFALGALACSGAADDGKPAGNVVEVAGPVSAVAAEDDRRRALAVGDGVARDDTIETGAGGRVSIRLEHNRALWNLGANKSRRVDESVAWTAPGATADNADLADRDRTAAAGRHAEREAAETAPARAPRDMPAAAESELAEEVPASGREAAPTAQPAVPDAPPAAPRAPAPAPPPRAGRSEAPAEEPARKSARRRAAKKQPERNEVGGGGLGSVGEKIGGTGAGTGSGASRGAGAPNSPAARSSRVVVELRDSKGPLAKEVLQRMGRRMQPSMRACYERVRPEQASKTTFGIALRWLVNPGGGVESLQILQAPDELRQCLHGRLSKIRFPAADGETSFSFFVEFQIP